MRPSPDAHHHEYAESLLEDYVLGTLSADDREWMDAHLWNCPTCQEETAAMAAAVQALPFGAPEPDVPVSDDLWDRIERSVTSTDAGPVPLSTEPAPTPVADQPPPPPQRLRPRQWLMIAALMLLSLAGGVVLGQVVPLFDEDEPETQTIAIEFTDPGITATGELRYMPEEQVFVLTIDDMPEAPEGHVYQAWLIEDDQPVPAGVMNIAQGEVASVGDRNQFDTFAITVELGPLGNDAPTSDPIIVAPLQEEAGT